MTASPPASPSSEPPSSGQQQPSIDALLAALGLAPHEVQVFDPDGTLLDVWPNIHRPCGMTVGPDGNIYVGELNGVANLDGALGIGHRVSVFDRGGRLIGRFGAPEEGSAAGQFIAPHGIAVDSRGDVYVGEVSFTIRGSHMDPPRALPSLTKLTRTA